MLFYFVEKIQKIVKTRNRRKCFYQNVQCMREKKLSLSKSKKLMDKLRNKGTFKYCFSRSSIVLEVLTS